MALEANMQAETSTIVLYRYTDGTYLRPATREEEEASIRAAETDGGSGVIMATVDGTLVACYVIRRL